MGKHFKKVLERMDNLFAKWKNLNKKGKFIVLAIALVVLGLVTGVI